MATLVEPRLAPGTLSLATKRKCKRSEENNASLMCGLLTPAPVWTPGRAGWAEERIAVAAVTAVAASGSHRRVATAATCSRFELELHVSILQAEKRILVTDWTTEVCYYIQPELESLPYQAKPWGWSAPFQIIALIDAPYMLTRKSQVFKVEKCRGGGHTDE